MVNTLLDELIEDQRRLTAVERFSRAHDRSGSAVADNGRYSSLMPATPLQPGRQYAFEVNLDLCSGCKACVTACHSMNGLEEGETWRSVGLLLDANPARPSVTQHVTTACHHCTDPGCLSGCPVLAYEKDPVTGVVKHLDDQCIGCQYCIMKCPYEVPKYSTSKGIVRKCDMCSDRLANGEAPACAQACPNEAIRITTVDIQAVSARYRQPGGDSFLPDSPDSSITCPTTRYLQKSPAADSLAADHQALRREPSHWPLVAMLVLTQAGAGAMTVAALSRTMGVPQVPGVLGTAGTVLLLLGVGAATLHLGQPLRAWRAFLGWRRSWLSREILAFQAALGGAILAVSAPLLQWPSWSQDLLGWIASILSLGAVAASAMVYIDTSRPSWRAQLTSVQFVATTAALGLRLCLCVLAWKQGPKGAIAGIWLAVIAVEWLRHTAMSRWIRQAAQSPERPDHPAARATRGQWEARRSVELLLWASATLAQGIALTLPWQGMVVLTGVATLCGVAVEVLQRERFFAGAMARRMPGGIAS